MAYKIEQDDIRKSSISEMSDSNDLEQSILHSSLAGLSEDDHKQYMTSPYIERLKSSYTIPSLEEGGTLSGERNLFFIMDESVNTQTNVRMPSASQNPKTTITIFNASKQNLNVFTATGEQLDTLNVGTSVTYYYEQDKWNILKKYYFNSLLTYENITQTLNDLVKALPLYKEDEIDALLENLYNDLNAKIEQNKTNLENLNTDYTAHKNNTVIHTNQDEKNQFLDKYTKEEINNLVGQPLPLENSILELFEKVYEEYALLTEVDEKINNLKDGVSSDYDTLNKIVNFIDETKNSILGNVVEDFNTLEKLYDFIVTTIGGAPEGLETLGALYDYVNTTFNRVLDGVEDRGNSLKKLLSLIDENLNGINNINSEITDIKESINTLIEKDTEIENSISDIQSNISNWVTWDTGDSELSNISSIIQEIKNLNITVDNQEDTINGINADIINLVKKSGDTVSGDIKTSLQNFSNIYFNPFNKNIFNDSVKSAGVTNSSFSPLSVINDLIFNDFLNYIFAYNTSTLITISNTKTSNTSYYGFIAYTTDTSIRIDSSDTVIASPILSLPIFYRPLGERNPDDSSSFQELTYISRDSSGVVTNNPCNFLNLFEKYIKGGAFLYNSFDNKLYYCIYNSTALGSKEIFVRCINEDLSNYFNKTKDKINLANQVTGTLATANIANNAVTNAKIANGAVNSIKTNFNSSVGMTSIEFSKVSKSAGHGGYIDFRYNGSTADNTSRIIESASGKLEIIAQNGLFLNGKELSAGSGGNDYPLAVSKGGTNTQDGFGWKNAYSDTEFNAKIRLSYPFTTQQLVDAIMKLNQPVFCMVYGWRKGQSFITDFPSSDLSHRTIINFIDNNQFYLETIDPSNLTTYIGCVSGGKFQGWIISRYSDGKIPSDIISPSVLTYTNNAGTWTETKLSDGKTMLEGRGNASIITPILLANTQYTKDVAIPKTIILDRTIIALCNVTYNPLREITSNIAIASFADISSTSSIKLYATSLQTINGQNTISSLQFSWYFRGILT